MADERETSATAAASSDERYKLLFESNPIPMWVFDGETLAFLAVNDAAVQGYGYSREEFARMTIKDIRPEEDLAALSDDLARSPTLSARRTWRHRRKDGSLIDVEVTAHAFVFEGRPARLVLAHDVTLRQRLEEELIEARKMEALGLLAGGIAHDFNNVLSVILSLSSVLIAELGPDEPMRVDLGEIMKAGERAATLTQQLLAFSRQQVVEPRQLDLNQIIRDLDKMLRRLVGSQVQLVIVAAPGLGTVRADRAQIEQVLMDLVVNARDAMPQGGKLILETANVELDEAYVQAHRGVEAGPHVVLAVSDTGIGMDPATQARIFEPFFTTKASGKGTGLGLATVFGIVKQSGGHISVASEPGRGSTFKIYFPRTARQQRAGHDGRSLATAVHGWETILLVEDDDPLRALAQTLLRRNGYHVIEARNAGEAFLICEQHHGTIHLLLTDVVMPQMSGPQLALRLGAIRPEMKIICMSGYPGDLALSGGQADAGMAFLQKPITPETLTRKVREVLDAPGPEQAERG